MIFLWKKYLEQKKIPNIIFHGTLQTMLKTKLKYDEKTESFMGLTSKHLPQVMSFMTFWDVTIQIDEYSELEINEITDLFILWSGKTFKISGDPNNFVLELITHFFPEIMIEENKYINGIQCSLWDKNADVTSALESYKIQNEYNKDAKTLYMAYEYYCTYTKKNYIVSKRYFEKLLRETMSQYIDSDGFISSKWFNT